MTIDPGGVKIKSSTVTTSQTNGDPTIKVILRLEGFKDGAQAHKALRFIAEKLSEFEGQKKLE